MEMSSREAFSGHSMGPSVSCSCAGNDLSSFGHRFPPGGLEPLSMVPEHRNILLVCPEFPQTYWGMSYSLPAVFRRAFMPPLGLLTIAALTHPSFHLRLVDTNCRPLTDADLHWADVVCFTAMFNQAEGLFRHARRARNAGKLVVFGGPYPTACFEECMRHCDAVVRNEGEITWPQFIRDLERGCIRKEYATDQKPDLSASPCPRFGLLEMSDYAMMAVQFSRGCPFNCEFCDVTALFGRAVRTKSPSQILLELETLFRAGYRGAVFFADDNFIGDKRQAGRLLEVLRRWNEKKRHPFYYFTQASLDLSRERTLLEQMVEAHFKGVFLGIESPSMESLVEARKLQNTRGSLLESVKAIQHAGLVVHAGFIVGFDSDGEDIFGRQIDFIRKAAIPNAFLELLSAPPGTDLYERMKREGRLKEALDDNLADGTTNIRTMLPEKRLLEGYRDTMATLYEPREYFERALEQFLRLPRPRSYRARLKNLRFLGPSVLGLFRPSRERPKRPERSFAGQWKALTRFFLHMPPSYRHHALKFLIALVKARPERLPGAMFFVFMGAHFHAYTRDHVIPKINARIEDL